VGKQQRLCLARTLAVDPEVILMDEPTSALDAKSTEAIEALILKLKRERTIVLVTHNLGQARRVSDLVARIALRDQAGEIVESGRPNEVLCDNAVTEGDRDRTRQTDVPVISTSELVSKLNQINPINLLPRFCRDDEL
jgi:phosphate transport system ATP-binding protein